MGCAGWPFQSLVVGVGSRGASWHPAFELCGRTLPFEPGEALEVGGEGGHAGLVRARPMPMVRMRRPIRCVVRRPHVRRRPGWPKASHWPRRCARASADAAASFGGYGFRTCPAPGTPHSSLRDRRCRPRRQTPCSLGSRPAWPRQAHWPRASQVQIRPWTRLMPLWVLEPNIRTARARRLATSAWHRPSPSPLSM